MREPSTGPGGKDHPAVGGVIIALVQDAPSLPHMLTVSKLLFPSPAFFGYHPLLSEMPALALRSNSNSPISPIVPVFNPCWHRRDVLQEPGEVSAGRDWAGGLGTARWGLWDRDSGVGRAVTAGSHTLSSATGSTGCSTALHEHGEHCQEEKRVEMWREREKK